MQVFILLAFNLSASRPPVQCYFTYHFLMTVKKSLSITSIISCFYLTGSDLTISGLIYVFIIATVHLYPLQKIPLQLEIAPQMDYRLVSVSDCLNLGGNVSDCDTARQITHPESFENLVEGIINLL